MADASHDGDDYTLCSGKNNSLPFSDSVQVDVPLFCVFPFIMMIDLCVPSIY